ncbi:hypothetical protein ACFSTC_47345 [Nonomuraea ferruginea]
MLQRILRMAVAVTVVVLALVPDSLVGRVAGALPGDCPPRDTRVLARYPITGYWMIPRSDACVTRRMVEAIHGVGADTLITFGARLLPASVGPDGRVGGAFDDCVEDGRTCYQAARDTGRTIRQVYTYTASEHFGAGVLRCPGLDRRIENGGRVYYRLMLGDSCEASSYDLLLVAADGDGVGHMMTEAAAQGMKVFPGLPVPPQRRGQAVAARPGPPAGAQRLHRAGGRRLPAAVRGLARARRPLPVVRAGHAGPGWRRPDHRPVRGAARGGG